MATTVRLPEALQDEATAYAQGLGLSLNGLIAVALRDYLDGRRQGGATGDKDAGAVAPVPPPPKGGLHSGVPSIEGRAQVKPPPKGRMEAAVPVPANRRAPCPCGSGKRYSQCHGRASVAGEEHGRG